MFKPMIILVLPFLLRKNFIGFAFRPFLIVKDDILKTDAVFMNHERIHFRQQLELLVVPFYLWYGIEYLIRRLQYQNHYTAYQNISFEREAYTHEKDLLYLKKRPFSRFLKYL